MILKCGLKFIFGAVFLIYGTFTINMLTWVSKHYRTPLTTTEVQGLTLKFWEQNESQVPEETEGQYDDATYEYRMQIIENNAKRRRKILTDLLKEYDANGNKNGSSHEFRYVGNITIFSAFYDDRENLDHDSSVIRIMGLARLDSSENLVCRYTNSGSDSWILATKHEMCDNHGKNYGGFMFICNTPPDIEIVPRKIYLQSLTDLGKNRQTGKDNYVNLDVLPIKSRLINPMIDVSDSFNAIGNPYQHSNLPAKAPAADVINGDFTGAINNHYDNTVDPTKEINNNRETVTEDKDRKDSINKDPERAGMDGPTTSDMKKPDKLLYVSNGLQLAPNKSLGLAVCIPPLFGAIPLSNFIQYMELLKLQGVSHVFMYKIKVSENIQHMLRYYSKQGFLSVIDWQLPGSIKDSIWYHGQIVSVQDCLYRTMGRYDYVAFLDIDELIIPRKQWNWVSMLHKLENIFKNDLGNAGYIFKSAFFDPDPEIPEFPQHSKLSFFRNVKRTEMVSSVRTKLIIQPEYVVEMGIHHISRPLNTSFDVYINEVDPAISLIHHYRKCTTVSDSAMNCRPNILDTSILKYESILSKNYHAVVKENLKHFQSTMVR